MSHKQPITDTELARRIGYMLHREEHKIFGKNIGGSLQDVVDRLLSAGGAVNPAVYKVAFILNAALPRMKLSASGPSV
jgi:hypothetical protein